MRELEGRAACPRHSQGRVLNVVIKRSKNPGETPLIWWLSELQLDLWGSALVHPPSSHFFSSRGHLEVLDQGPRHSLCGYEKSECALGHEEASSLLEENPVSKYSCCYSLFLRGKKVNMKFPQLCLQMHVPVCEPILIVLWFQCFSFDTNRKGTHWLGLAFDCLDFPNVWGREDPREVSQIWAKAAAYPSQILPLLISLTFIL